jgi:hypothetical protein
VAGTSRPTAAPPRSPASTSPTRRRSSVRRRHGNPRRRRRRSHAARELRLATWRAWHPTAGAMCSGVGPGQNPWQPTKSLDHEHDERT